MTLDTHSARLLPSIVAPPTIAFHPGSAETPTALRGMTCPNCGGTGDKTLVLTVDVQLPDNPTKRLRVLRCPGCTANFYDSQVPPDYAEPALNNRGRVPFYVQQGAGVSLITRPLAQLRRAAGSSYMEVGCGYGFGLDFALNTRGWTGLGIDPAPLAALGRDALALPIELRYLRDDDEARGTMDVVMGSEVIEHVTSPSAFVRTLKAMLKPGGVLILTTPNGDDIDPATPPGIIIPLLSPSLHLVIQNRTSLAALLHQAGFAHVSVDIDSHSLVAFASDVPLDLEQDAGTLRRALRNHLAHRAGTVDPSSDLFLAFAGRAFYESMNDGDLEAADRAWALLVPGVQARFGLDLDAMTTLPEAVRHCSLEEMAQLVPLNLGGMLYARAIRRLASGTPRAELERSFLLSAEAAGAMRRALGELAMEDGQTEDIGWTSLAEAVLCAADAGHAGVADRIRGLPPAPNGGEERRQSIAIRAVTNLINAGRHELGGALVRDLGLEGASFAQPGGAALSEAQRDGLFCLAVLDARIGPDGRPLGNVAAAPARFRRVREHVEAGSGLWWSALRGEMQALRLLGDTAAMAALAETVNRENPGTDMAIWALTNLVSIGQTGAARAIAESSGLRAAAFTQPGSIAEMTEEERDAVFSLAMLDIEAGSGNGLSGDPATARGRFLRVRHAAAEGSAAWWASLTGEVQALDLLGDRQGIAALAESIMRDHPQLDTARWALPHLVNAGNTAAARIVAERSGLRTAAFTQPGSAAGMTTEERDIVFALAVLDAETGPGNTPLGDPAMARGRFPRVRRAAQEGSSLWWAALNGEAQALELLGDRRAMAELAESVVREHPGVDAARWAMPHLVNDGRYAAARLAVGRSALKDAPFAMPGGTQPLLPEDRDMVFYLAVLDAEIGPDGRAVGSPAMARGRFARVRQVAPPGEGLWLAALRGELQALDLLEASDDAAALTREVEERNPGIALPPDILARVGKG